MIIYILFHFQYPNLFIAARWFQQQKWAGIQMSSPKNSKATAGLKKPGNRFVLIFLCHVINRSLPQKWVPLYFRNHLVVCRKLMCLFIIILFTIWAITGLPILRMYTSLQNNKYTIPFASILTVNYIEKYRVIEPLSHEGTRVRIGPQYPFHVSNGD